MEKEAVRKKSNDPVQEHLRQNKDAWNKRVSLLIEDLKQFKKLMNGFASKFHMEKSKIVNPIPGDPSSVLNELAGSFRTIAEGGLAIVKEQEEYSKTRRQKKPMTPQASEDYNLVSEAGKVSRFFSSLKGPWFGHSLERKRKMYRLQMLDTLVRLRKQYELFRANIILKSPDSIVVSSQLLNKIIRTISSAQSAIKAYIASLPKEERDELKAELEKNKEVEESKPEPEENKKNKIKKNEVAIPTFVAKQLANEKPSEEDNKPISHKVINEPPKQDDSEIAKKKQDLERVIEGLNLDFNNNKNSFTEINPKLSLKFKLGVSVFKSSLTHQFATINIIEKNANDVAETYKQIILDLQQKLKLEGNSLQELKANREKVTASINSLQKTADHLLKRWYGKLRHKAWSDETTASRVDLYDLSTECLELIKPMLETLEESFDIKDLIDFFAELKEKNDTALVLMDPLKDKTREHRFNNSLVNVLSDPNVMDYDLDISKSHKDLLKKRLERDKINEWMRLYHKGM